MRFFSRKLPAEKVTVKKVKGYKLENSKMIPNFGVFVSVRDRKTKQISMADFLDNYSDKHTLDRVIEKLFRIDPHQVQDIVDDIKRERELDEMELLLMEERTQQF